MSIAEPTVVVVDDDAAVLDSLTVLLDSVGMKSESYSSPQEFLDRHDPDQPGCVVLDIRMPGIDGLEVQRRLNESGSVLPIIIVSGHGDIRMAVDAMHAGAVDFLEKPITETALLEQIRVSFDKNAELRSKQRARVALATRLQKLTPREREIMHLVISGKSIQVIAAELGISHKTVECHRTRIMHKTEAQTIVDLARMVSLANS